MRARWARFAEQFAIALQCHSVDESIQVAAKACGWFWGSGKPLNARQVAKRAKAIMLRPDWVENMRDLFEVAGGFSPVDGVRKVVQHIEGRIEVQRTAVTKDGEIVNYTETLPPSLEALKHYHSMTVPKATKQVQVDTRMLVAHRMVSDAPPVMRARVLKPADAKLSDS